MQSRHLERAERALAAIRHQRELSPAVVEALEEILGAVRTVDRGLASLEGKGVSPPTAPNGIHLVEDDGQHAKQILALIGEQ
jgi:hypothetical protein